MRKILTMFLLAFSLVIGPVWVQYRQDRIALAKADEEHVDMGKKIALKNQKLDQCEKEGNVPVMGYGLTVVCIRKANVAWSWSGGNW